MSGAPILAQRRATTTPLNATAATLRASIGEASQRSGVSAKMIRHYESLGLLASVARQSNGYRQYSERDVHTLQFIKRARDLGFSMAEIAELVSLWLNRRRASASVKRIAQTHADELSKRIAAMQAMQQTLAHLIACCHGDQRPDCPILEDLAGHSPPPGNG
jgi:MerR family transcriptional regulator, copper efflux regulator